MASTRRGRTVERWNTLLRAGSGIVALGVAGKSAASLGLVVALIGLAASPVVIAVGAVIALSGVGAWWWSADVISTRVEFSRGRAAWMLWCIPTWSAVGGVLDLFSGI